MSPRVYVETSVVSYLTSFPSRDIVIAAHQQITQAWWATRSRFDLYVSEAVLAEAGGGDPVAAERRLSALANIAILAITGDVVSLATRFVDAGALPPKAFVDALHVAAAAVHGMDFLLTWNCSHIANAQIRGRLEALCRSLNLQPPMICTPEELQE
jgi:predicted nucleic acid-binding protein